MAQIVFYTKIGCLTSQKQIALLQAAGHQVLVRDLLAHNWTSEELLSYLGELPASERFNPNATRIKSGEINPESCNADQTLELLLEDHLLIRRPLMESNGVRVCGFDPARVHAWVGLVRNGDAFVFRGDLNSCSHPVAGAQAACP